LQVAGTAPGANEEAVIAARSPWIRRATFPSRRSARGPTIPVSFSIWSGCAQCRFGGEGQVGGVYHSAYDSYDYYRPVRDPDLFIAGALAKKPFGAWFCALADADVRLSVMAISLIPCRAISMKVKKLADTSARPRRGQAKMLAGGAYRPRR